MAAPVISQRRKFELATADGRGYGEIIVLSSVGDSSPAVVASDLTEIDGAIAHIQQIGGKIAPVTIGGKKATGTLTAAANASEGDTVSIVQLDGVTRTYTLTATVDAAYKVLIGATASDTLDNLIAAINGDAGEGTLYGTGTVAHADFVAAAGAGDTMDITAKAVGRQYNALGTTETGAQLSWGAATALGGLNANELQIGYTSADDDLKPAFIQVFGVQ